MVRISGVALDGHKHVGIAIQSIYGIGKSRAKKICEKLALDFSNRVKSLDENAIIGLQSAVNEYIIEGDLRREVSMRIKHLRDIKCYRGLRHLKRLPVRGQRTRTNARTRKGPTGNLMKKDAKKDVKKDVYKDNKDKKK